MNLQKCLTKQSKYNQSFTKHTLEKAFHQETKLNIVLLYSLERHNDAIECYEKAIIIDPMKAEAYAQKGQFEEAIKFFDQSIQCDPQAELAYTFKSNALYSDYWDSNLFSQNRYEESLQCYDDMLSIDPNNQQKLQKRSDLLDFNILKKGLQFALDKIRKQLQLQIKLFR